MKRGLCLMLAAASVACGNKMTHQGTEWNVEESAEFQADRNPDNVWWDESTRALSPNRENGSLSCGALRRDMAAPLKLTIGYPNDWQSRIQKGAIYISLGPPMLESTRHWFLCGDTVSEYHQVSDAIVKVVCGLNSIAWHLQTDTVSGLPEWLVDHMNWEAIAEFRRSGVGPYVARLEVEVRTYEPQNEFTHVDMIEFRIGGDDVTQQSAGRYGPFSSESATCVSTRGYLEQTDRGDRRPLTKEQN